MQVRDATVGPLSGTSPVSAAFTSTASYGTPSVSATICASIVRVPWPISVLPTRITHAGVGERERRLRRELDLAGAGEAGAVKEEREADAPVRAGQRLAAPGEVRALHGLAQHLAGAAVGAERLAGRRRVAGAQRVPIAQRAPDRAPSCSAMRSMCTSTANCVCGAPKPRNAPFGGVFVIIARPRMRTWSQRYGPDAWSTPRDSTTALSVA